MADNLNLRGSVHSQAELTAAELCDRYGDQVYLFACMVSRGQLEADDIAQDALVRAIKALPRFRPVAGGLEAWLWTIVVNVARNHRRLAFRRAALWEKLRGREKPADSMATEDRGLEDRLRRLEVPLPGAIRSSVLSGKRPSPWLPHVFALGVAIGVPALLVVLLVVTVAPNFLLRTRTTRPTGIVAALSVGVPAVISPGADRRFVWLTGPILQPTGPAGSHSSLVTGMNVDVLDWTGALRYHFQLPHPTIPYTPIDIQSISADGTRALLDDGTVVDQTGAVAGKIPSLVSNGPYPNRVRWMSDNSAVCAATSNEPMAPQNTSPPPPKGQANPSPLPTPPYAQPGADHSVTLKSFGLDGRVRTVATIGVGPLGEPSGAQPDMASVLSCAANTDLAVVARYHDATNNATNPAIDSTNMTVALWAIRLSTGAILYHQPETRMALGRAFFFGSQNGQLVVEFLWNSKVWGSETDVVLQMPSGHPVPLTVTDVPNTAGLSADGTRIFRGVGDQVVGDRALELIDASSGRVIRRVVTPGPVSAEAVAEPNGSSFMVDIDGHFALVDGDGGITVLNLQLTTGMPNGVGFPYPPGVQG